MADLLLELPTKSMAQRVAESFKLPPLLSGRRRRSYTAWAQRELEDRSIAVGGADTGELGTSLGSLLAEAAARTVIVGSDRAADVYRRAAEVWSRSVTAVAPVAPPEHERSDALLFDATGLRTPDSLRAVYEFFHLWVDHISLGGRVVLVAWEPEESGNLTAQAASAALEGFTKSLARELGGRGISVNLVYCRHGAQDRLAGPLRFLLGEHAALVTGQLFRVTELLKANPFQGYAQALKGRSALISGAGSELGAETARAFVREGAHVICLDRPSEDISVERLSRELGGSSRFVVDMTDPDAPSRIERYVREKHGGIDIVVHTNSVGSQPSTLRDKPLGKLKADAWELALRVELSGVLRVTERLLGEKAVREHGRLLFASSAAALAGQAGQTHHAASMSGINGLVRFLAPGLAAQGIAVNAVARGPADAATWSIRHLANRLSALGQSTQATDMAEALTFLAMPTAHGLTGSILQVGDGTLAVG